ncbi:TetR/AcrR family transcriptional regulator [Ketobacter sp. MCCC 1A13808]|uniref:TetR/AcrR family transcriptional regulator n=1 Tax=Ketobacter sp. MCCC 1A13808 TaxID=2602738 RepID=UPI000F1F8945|nr:TetR/AcrR family transcriptional regulator [Ketobacter sp. MCCC 1A13808]MVF11687.1 TetR/AcrR family transcriptional regulator [Ketobacter sp. MCCC 1A13808]RLP55300.1 MAG: TetR/AcrR family transcriptional regulator [Ketobacter sp.]
MVDNKSDTREKLILVAIRMFAEQGFSGVSMRTINSAAGTKNSSAVHYHFGNKMGIIEAIMEKLNFQLRPLFDRLHDDLSQRMDDGDLTPEDMVMAIQLPYWVLYCTPVYGRYAVKLIARLMQEADDELKELYNRYLTEPMERTMNLMARLQPNKNQHHLRFQLMHCFMASISGISAIDLMDKTPLGDIRFSRDAEMMLTYVYYVANGMGCEDPDYGSFDMGFWSRYAEYMSMSPAPDEPLPEQADSLVEPTSDSMPESQKAS